MKKIVFVTLLFITACHKTDPKQQRAEQLVKIYLASHIISQDKVEKITFSHLIRLKASYLKTNEGVRSHKQILLEDDSIAKLDSTIDHLGKNLPQNSSLKHDSLKKLMKEERPLDMRRARNMLRLITMVENYKGTPLGYKIAYTYKVTNNMRQDFYHEMTFNIDSTLSKITSVKDTDIEMTDIKW